MGGYFQDALADPVDDGYGHGVADGFVPVGVRVGSAGFLFYLCPVVGKALEAFAFDGHQAADKAACRDAVDGGGRQGVGGVCCDSHSVLRLAAPVRNLSLDHVDDAWNVALRGDRIGRGSGVPQAGTGRGGEVTTEQGAGIKGTAEAYGTFRGDVADCRPFRKRGIVFSLLEDQGRVASARAPLGGTCGADRKRTGYAAVLGVVFVQEYHVGSLSGLSSSAGKGWQDSLVESDFRSLVFVHAVAGGIILFIRTVMLVQEGIH